MPAMFQIHADDLCQLEAILPKLMEAHVVNPRERGQWRVVKRILSDVRFNYGPHEGVEIIPVDDQ